MFYSTTHSTHFYLWKEGNVLFNDALNTFLFMEGRKCFIQLHTQHILFWKEGNVLFNDALNTFLFMEGRKSFIQLHTQHIFIYGRKEMFYLMMHSTHFYLWKEENVLFNDALSTFLFMEGRKYCI